MGAKNGIPSSALFHQPGVSLKKKNPWQFTRRHFGGIQELQVALHLQYSLNHPSFETSEMILLPNEGI